MSVASSTRLGLVFKAVCVLTSAAGARAEVRLPAVLADGMVLQRDCRASLWGTASAGAKITIAPSWTEQPTTVVCDDQGRWSARVKTSVAGGPHRLRFSGDGEVELGDVWLGDVWLCSGQSNMEWSVANYPNERAGVPGAKAEIAAADYPRLRLFDVPNQLSTFERREGRGEWRACSPDTVAAFSATAYYFGRKLHEELGVPIGLVTVDWGGTPVEAWMSADALRSFRGYDDMLDYLAIASDPNQREVFAQRFREGWWDALDGLGARPLAANWTRGGDDASLWSATELPATLAGPELSRFDGIVFFRREIELPAAWAGQSATLELGPIDDRDDAWFDGVHVGSTREDNKWSVARSYAVPASAVRAGKVVIAVRMLDNAGPGGINGKAEQMQLRSADPKLAPIALAGAWQMHVGAKADELPEMPHGLALDQNSPSVLFNGMLAPLTPLSLRGFTWYQGESNVGRAASYHALFTTMIAAWRERFGNRELPFYFVQIAPYAYRGGKAASAAHLRDAQRLSLSAPHTGMACTLDIGNASDVHPDNKQEVGRRLAYWALAKTYGRKLVSYSGPLYSSMKSEGSAIRVRFAHADAGLQCRGARLAGFTIAGADKQFHEAEALIDGDSVVVSSARVPKPVAVRYAWTNAPTATLFNGAGLPASSFRSDDWSGDLPPVIDSGRTAHLSDEPGFTALFNGRDLSGWINVNCDDSTWRAADGVIACSGVPTGLLRTDKQYENYVLELEWRHLVDQGNAGLFVHSDALPARGQPFTRAIEVQVMTGLEGDWYTSDGDVFPIHGAVMHPENGRVGSSRAYPTEKRVNAGGEWNHYRVTCVDGDLDLAVNGVVVTRGRACSPRKGYICLEAEGSPCEFRNLRIRELPASQPALAPEHVAALDQGFRSLYNGVDFEGWKFGPEHDGHWRANDWSIAFDGEGADLWSEHSFKDFVLVADWRWTAQAHDADLAVILPSGEQALDADGKPLTKRVKEAGDSGIYLRGSSKSQVNIWCWPIGSGEVYGYRTDTAMAPEVRAGVTPKSVADAPLGEWNRFEITLKGERLSVVLNGQLVIDRAQLPGVAESGPIALQMHHAPIEFANLYIKELR